ncbi:hypothetical protein L6452_02670 [Arctium lappa]|uniref:Uncharacterized protein n=1 Tax=Arctium lappa TaxID=4217 RepID=A0ACB9FL19_ARCLA|nr:hypothetical protein L6452_02670 [Arctium lappa]
MYMGNATTAKVEGRGRVNLKLTSGKELVLTNVLHVPAITKNLISGSTLSNKGFKIVFESDKFVITKGGVYVGKGYLDEGLFKLSVVNNDNVNIVNSNKTAGSSSASVNPWLIFFVLDTKEVQVLSPGIQVSLGMLFILRVL